MSTIQPTRPKTRGECPNERPCPWITCRYHLLSTRVERVAMGRGRRPPGEPGPLFADADAERIVSDAERWLARVERQGGPSCALDVAARGGLTLNETGALLSSMDGSGITRERVRQIETGALIKLRRGLSTRDRHAILDLLR